MRPVLLIIATLASCLALPTKHSNLKLYGGKTAAPGQFPFVVAINVTDIGTEFCEGSIIHENWILTTATCTEISGFKPEELVVVSGTNQLDTDAGDLFNVSQILVHPNFTLENGLYPKEDIALFRIDGSFTFTDLIQSITLGDVSVDDTAVVAGWGYTEDGLSSALLYAELTAWSNEDCTKRIIGTVDIQPGEVCALGSLGVGLCGRDAGAPLIRDGTLVGLGSWSITDCGRGEPDVFTRVSYYKDWIDSVIKS